MIAKKLKLIKKQLNVNNGVLLIALLITISWVWGTVTALQSNYALERRVSALKQQNDYIALQNQTLKLQQSYYKTNEYLELAARIWLDRASPGEKVLILPPATVSDTPQPLTPSTSTTQNRSNFGQWLDFLFGAR